MTRNLSGGALALAIAWTAGLATPAGAQGTTSAIKISYEDPQDIKLRAVQERLKKRQVLERLQKFLSPLKLPRELTVRTAQCGGLVIPYQAGQTVTLCYEYVAQVEKQAPPPNNIGFLGAAFVTRDMAIVGPVVHALLHDVSRVIFDMLEVPVWGNVVDASDHLAAFIMLQFGADVAQKTLFGTAWFLATTQEEFDPLNVSPYVQQRYYNMLCMAVGYDFVRYAMFIPLKRPQQPGDLPLHRVGKCASAEPSEYTEYAKVRYAFVNILLKDHIDERLMKEVQGIDWLKGD
jgi:Putative metallopeptidase